MYVLQKSVQLFKRNLNSVLPISLAVTLGINLPLLFLMESYPSSSTVNHLIGMQDHYSFGIYAIWLISFILLSSLFVKFNFLYHEKSHNYLDCLKQAISQFFPLLLVALLYSIVVICGMVFLIIPGIILSVSLLLSFVSRLVDHKDTFDSLVESHRLVWGNWWYTLMMMSIPLLIHTSLFLGLLIVTTGLIALIQGHWEYTLRFAFMTNAILQIMIIPLITSETICLFYHLKEKSLKYPSRK